MKEWHEHLNNAPLLMEYAAEEATQKCGANLVDHAKLFEQMKQGKRHLLVLIVTLQELLLHGLEV